MWIGCAWRISPGKQVLNWTRPSDLAAGKAQDLPLQVTNPHMSSTSSEREIEENEEEQAAGLAEQSLAEQNYAAVPLRPRSELEEAVGYEFQDKESLERALVHAVEAILGAVYLDGGLEAAISVWHRIRGDHDEERLLEVLRGDYKSQLQQFTQAEIRLTPYYRLVGTIGPEHSKLFHVEVLVGGRVLSSGIGRNKQIAEQAAAEAALRDLLEEKSRNAEVESESESEGESEV